MLSDNMQLKFMLSQSRKETVQCKANISQLKALLSKYDVKLKKFIKENAELKGYLLMLIILRVTEVSNSRKKKERCR